MAYVFPEMNVSFNGSLLGTLKIELTTQSLVDYTFDWSSPITATYNPFEDLPEIIKSLEGEAGTLGSGQSSFKCNNRKFYSTVRMYDYLYNINVFDTCVLIRLSYKPVGSSYAYRYVGMILHEDIKTKINNDTDTWKIDFTATNILMQLDKVNINTSFFNSHLAHATYDFIPSNVYICYGYAGTPVKTALIKFKFFDGVNYIYLNASTLHFFKLTDVIASVARSIGVTATYNNSATTDCDWIFYGYNGSADIAKTFDDLYIVSSAYNASVYQHFNGFFDETKLSDASFYTVGTALEMLKALVTPFGLVASFEFTSAGVMYIAVNQLKSNSPLAFSTILKDKEFNPAQRVLTGMKVNNVNSVESLVGSVGDGATAIRNIFLSCNGIPFSNDWRYEQVGITADISCLMQGLYIKDGNDIYSVYKIDVKSYGGNNTWGKDLTANYDSINARSLVGDACASYWYCQFNEASEQVGIYRPLVRRLVLRVPFTINAVPRKYIEDNGLKYWILEVKDDMKKGINEIICETGEAS